MNFSFQTRHVDETGQVLICAAILQPHPVLRHYDDDDDDRHFSEVGTVKKKMVEEYVCIVKEQLLS